MIQGRQQGPSGSIGAGAPRYDGRNGRIKGFHNRIAEPEGMCRLLQGVRRMMEAHGAGRGTLRVLAPAAGLRRTMDSAAAEGFEAEAAIPHREYAIVYLGRNTGQRAPAPGVLAAEREDLRAAIESHRGSGGSAAEGFSIDAPSPDSREDVRALVSLWRQAFTSYIFPIEFDTVRDVLSDDANLCFVARAGGRIVSSLVAERAAVDVEHVRLRLCELSEFATEPEFRGRGLMTMLQRAAIGATREVWPDAAIYAENRAEEPGSYRSSLRAGMHYGGTLMQHCTIEGDRRAFGQEGRHENLHVLYDPVM